MQDAHPLERAVGMSYYVSDAPGVGGVLRDDPEDFVVRELERVDAEPVDADPGGYPHLVVRVELRGWDTNDFAGALSNRLGISRERVSWAGTKDKHAVTTQLFSVDGASPDAVADAGAALDGVSLEVVGRTGRPVLFGDLAGNDFEITVRDVERPDGVDAVTAELRAFARGDVGTQGSGDDAESSNGSDSDRANGSEADHGTSSEADHTAGNDSDRVTDSEPDRATSSEEASTCVAVPNYFGQQRFGTARAVTHEVGLAIVRDDWEGAAMAYVGNPSDREPEATREARAAVEETRDWAGAVERFPSALGYERAICQRLAENGGTAPEDFREALEALPTNLQRLFVNAAQSFLFNRILSRRLERELPFHRPVAGDVVCFADGDAPADLSLPDADRTQRVTEDRLGTVRRHCDRGRAFVTAPLVGTETVLADGEPGKIERAVLEEVGVGPADFDRPGEFHSTGTRRAIVVATDLSTERVADDAVSFSFALPKGSYATVLLREYLQTDPEALT